MERIQHSRKYIMAGDITWQEIYHGRRYIMAGDIS
jgi:hypothetical protein